MHYSMLADLYERLERTPKKLEKRDALAEFYKKSAGEPTPPGRQPTLEKVVLMSTGTVFPQGGEDLGVAKGLIKKITAKAFGASPDAVCKAFKKTGDLGLTAEKFAESKKQAALRKQALTVDKVFDNLRQLPFTGGTGSQERKISLVVELLSQASPKEARYIVRTVIGDMRIGVAEGIVRDAIALAFGRESKDVEHAFNVLGNFGAVAEMAKHGGLKAEVRIFHPVRVMLADSAADLKEALEKFEEPSIEYKYDGFRISAHKDGSRVKIFSRRLDEVTDQFPDIVKRVKECVNAEKCIVEGEAVAVDAKGNPRPFQALSRRIQRKYDIEKTAVEIPVQVNLFDTIYLNGKSMMDCPLAERWQALKKAVKPAKNFHFADHIETKDFKEAEAFYKSALKAGHEGVIVKNMAAVYQPGKRVGYWLKVKPMMEPLDLVVIGAEWGEGKRSEWLGSLILGALADDAKGIGQGFTETGRMASGLTEEQMKDLTTRLKKIITSEEGKIVAVKPEVVAEIGYEEIQKSPKYQSGYALRFPRLLRIREDKSPSDANTVKDIEKLFFMQKKRR